MRTHASRRLARAGSDALLTVRLVVDPRAQGQRWTYWQRESARLHRTLYWYIKAKIEAIDAGLESPLSVWMPAIETGAGSTLLEQVEPHARDLSDPGRTLTMPLALPESVGA